MDEFECQDNRKLADDFYPPTHNPPPHSSTTSYPPGPSTAEPRQDVKLEELHAPQDASGMGANAAPEFGKYPLQLCCRLSHSAMVTHVEKRTTGGGRAWACICCLCGTWLLSLLVLCMDCFQKWYHHCSKCGRYVGKYSPTSTPMTKMLLIIASIAVVALEGFLIYKFLLNNNPFDYGYSSG